MSKPKPKLLFICSCNISRSRTAEDMFADSDKYEVKSAGFLMFDERSGQLVTQELVDWADQIFLMDEKHDKHLSKLKNGFNIENKTVILLGIPDIYNRGNKNLKRILRNRFRMCLIDVGSR